MATRDRIPTVLAPYIQLPPELSQIFIASTLSCNSTWLTSWYIGAALQHRNSDNAHNASVVLVSWLRDYAFWKTETRRSMGIDLSRFESQHCFTFVDGLGTSLTAGQDDLPSFKTRIVSAIEALSKHSERILLILDHPDVLLATSTVTMTAIQLDNTIMSFRGKIHSTIITCSVDQPLVTAARRDRNQVRSITPLEVECAAFISQQAHVSRFIFSCRELASGAARDVSGVLRITRGGDLYDDDSGFSGSGELEALYLVNKDGTVAVFERGNEQAGR